jgi:hypothetical protein
MTKILIKTTFVRTRHRKISHKIYQLVTDYNATIMKYPIHRKKTHNEEKRATFHLTITFYTLMCIVTFYITNWCSSFLLIILIIGLPSRNKNGFFAIFLF